MPRPGELSDPAYESLLESVMQVALDAPSDLVGRRDDPGTGGDRFGATVPRRLCSRGTVRPESVGRPAGYSTSAAAAYEHPGHADHVTLAADSFVSPRVDSHQPLLIANLIVGRMVHER
jgi:hypothetical protein